MIKGHQEQPYLYLFLFTVYCEKKTQFKMFLSQ